MMEHTFCIRPMVESDAAYFAEQERAQGWHVTEEKYLWHLQNDADGNSNTVVCELDGVPAGYVSVFYRNRGGAMADKGWPEIVDLGVLEKFRRNGVGGCLMDAAERIAGERNEYVRIGVGLHAGYGEAQRMYVRRGYMPDGSGVWYGESVCAPYSSCVNDDDLVLYLYKKLR